MELRILFYQFMHSYPLINRQQLVYLFMIVLCTSHRPSNQFRQEIFSIYAINQADDVERADSNYCRVITGSRSIGKKSNTDMMDLK